MLENIYVAAGIAVAFLCVWFYRRGVKDGMNQRNGAPPERIIPSLRERKEEKEAEAQQKDLEDKIARMMDGDPMKVDYTNLEQR